MKYLDNYAIYNNKNAFQFKFSTDQSKAHIMRIEATNLIEGLTPGKGTAGDWENKLIFDLRNHDELVVFTSVLLGVQREASFARQQKKFVAKLNKDNSLYILLSDNERSLSTCARYHDIFHILRLGSSILASSYKSDPNTIMNTLRATLKPTASQ